MHAHRRRRPVFAALLGLLAIPLVVAACATPPPLTPPPAVALGPCGLVVANDYGGRIMEPPYEMTMIFRPSGDEARLRLTGTGWGRTRATMTGPGKSVDAVIGTGSVDDAGMNVPGSWIMPAVGTWHFRFADDQCTREFDVEVKPRI